MRFKFKVTMEDRYQTEIEVEANSLNDAYKLCEQDIDACPVDSRSNTLVDSDTIIQPMPAVHNAEGLLGEDPEDSPDVILVDELSDEQKKYLNLK